MALEFFSKNLTLSYQKKKKTNIITSKLLQSPNENFAIQSPNENFVFSISLISTNHNTFLHQYLLSLVTFSFYDIFGQPYHSLMVIGVIANNPVFVVIHCYCQCLSYMHMQSLSHRSSVDILQSLVHCPLATIVIFWPPSIIN